MFVNDKITVNDYSSKLYGLDINLVRPCHQVFKVNNIDHYRI